MVTDVCERYLLVDRYLYTYVIRIKLEQYFADEQGKA